MQTDLNSKISQAFNEWVVQLNIKDIFLYDPCGTGQICFYILGGSGGLAAKVICYPMREVDDKTYTAPFEISQDVKDLDEVITMKLHKTLMDLTTYSRNCRQINLDGGDLGREIE